MKGGLPYRKKKGTIDSKRSRSVHTGRLVWGKFHGVWGKLVEWGSKAGQKVGGGERRPRR